MQTLDWHPDQPTLEWTRRLPVASRIVVAPQYAGHDLNATTWEGYIGAAKFPDFCYSSDEKVRCSPENIIRCFSEGAMLEALALTVGWGGMSRTNARIYAKGQQAIERVLTECARSITSTRSIAHAWKALAGNLGWSNVISSKTLNLLALSLGFENNPPVAIDNAVILKKFAPHYDERIRRLGGKPTEMGSWADAGSPTASWEAYNRYMTAICCWAEMQDWTTTQVEATIFANPTTFLA